MYKAIAYKTMRIEFLFTEEDMCENDSVELAAEALAEAAPERAWDIVDIDIEVLNV